MDMIGRIRRLHTPRGKKSVREIARIDGVVAQHDGSKWLHGAGRWPAEVPSAVRQPNKLTPVSRRAASRRLKADARRLEA